MPSPSTALVGFLLALAAAAGFASGPTWAVRSYELGMDWVGVLIWRFAIAAVVTWVVVLGTRRDRLELRSLTKRDVAVLLMLGLFYVANAGSYYIAVERIPASLAVLLSHSSMAMIAILSLRFGMPLSGKRAWMGLVLAFCGVAIIVGAPGGTDDLAGIGFAIASAVLHATWAMVAARQAGERRGRAVQGTSSGVAMAFVFVAAAAGLMLISVVRGDGPIAGGIPPAALPLLIPFGVVSALGIRAWYAATSRIGVARVTVIAAAEPVMAIGLAIVFLGESLTALQLIGAAAIVAAVLSVRPTTPAQRPVPSAVPS